MDHDGVVDEVVLHFDEVPLHFTSLHLAATLAGAMCIPSIQAPP
jgi:hypothetical protein